MKAFKKILYVFLSFAIVLSVIGLTAGGGKKNTSLAGSYSADSQSVT